MAGYYEAGPDDVYLAAEQLPTHYMMASQYANEEVEEEDGPAEEDGTDSDSETAKRSRPSDYKSKPRRKATQKPVGADQKRQAFSKRKRGLVLKAYQLHKLTDAKIFVFMVNDKGSSWCYASPAFGAVLHPSHLKRMRELAGATSQSRLNTEVMAHPRLDETDRITDDRHLYLGSTEALPDPFDPEEHRRELLSRTNASTLNSRREASHAVELAKREREAVANAAAALQAQAQAPPPRRQVPPPTIVAAPVKQEAETRSGEERGKRQRVGPVMGGNGDSGGMGMDYYKQEQQDPSQAMGRMGYVAEGDGREGLLKGDGKGGNMQAAACAGSLRPMEMSSLASHGSEPGVVYVMSSAADASGYPMNASTSPPNGSADAPLNSSLNNSSGMNNGSGMVMKTVGTVLGLHPASNTSSMLEPSKPHFQRQAQGQAQAGPAPVQYYSQPPAAPQTMPSGAGQIITDAAGNMYRIVQEDGSGMSQHTPSPASTHHDPPSRNTSYHQLPVSSAHVQSGMTLAPPGGSGSMAPYAPNPGGVQVQYRFSSAQMGSNSGTSAMMTDGSRAGMGMPPARMGGAALVSGNPRRPASASYHAQQGGNPQHFMSVPSPGAGSSMAGATFNFHTNGEMYTSNTGAYAPAGGGQVMVVQDGWGSTVSHGMAPAHITQPKAMGSHWQVQQLR